MKSYVQFFQKLPVPF